MKLTAIDQPSDHLMNVVRRADIVGNDRIKVFDVILGRARFLDPGPRPREGGGLRPASAAS